jgi:RNA polymerase sigma factor (sigma-70 family)
MPAAPAQLERPDPSTQTDLALLQRYAQHRDESAFAEIVRRYGGVVYATGRRVLRDRAGAEDVTQETFLRLMRSPDRCSQSLGGWLHRLATRLAVDALRSERSRHRREQTYEAPARTDDDAARAGDAPDLVAWRELSPRIDEALSELPGPARELLVAHFLRGRSQTELARETGTSPATMCRRMREAVEMLRRELSRRGVQVSGTLLAFLCLRHAATEAAPATLTLELGKMAMMSGAPMSGGAGGTVFVPAAAAKAAAAKAAAGPSWMQFIREAIDAAASAMPATRTIAVILLSLGAVAVSPWAVSKGWEAMSVIGARHEADAPTRHHVERREEAPPPDATHTQRAAPGVYWGVSA